MMLSTWSSTGVITLIILSLGRDEEAKGYIRATGAGGGVVHIVNQVNVCLSLWGKATVFETGLKELL